MTIELAKTASFRLDGKRALVTGGGRGIGLAAASALAAAGAHVTLAARTTAEIEEAAAAIRARGEKADALTLDVTNVEAAKKALAAIEPYQILVNNAGCNRPAYLPEVKAEDFDFIFSLNVRAAFFMAQTVALRLLEAKLPGSIINISSQMGHVGAARRTVYCASKHAMEGFTKAMARRGRGFGMTIIYADPRRLRAEEEAKFDATYRSFDDLLREADFVSLHPQLLPETRHLISDRQFSLMKPTAFVINTSRGPVIDEAALVRALKDNKIAGAGLDVYEHEPQVSPELIAMPNVVLTPHLGSAVLSLREGMAHVVVDNIIALIEGKPPVSCLNPQVLKKLF